MLSQRLIKTSMVPSFCIKRAAIALPLLITALSRNLLFADDTPEVAAAIARVESLDGEIRRGGDGPNGKGTQVMLIGSKKLKDDDLVFLRAFPDLRRLLLGGTAVTDAGLKHVAGLKDLTMLGLVGTK